MIWLNGEFSSSDAVISANDRGLLLGEAVFETVLAENGTPELADRGRLLAGVLILIKGGN